MYGDQQMMKTITITIVILTVLTLARGIMPRELARRLPRSTPFRTRSGKIICIHLYTVQYYNAYTGSNAYVNMNLIWNKRRGKVYSFGNLWSGSNDKLPWCAHRRISRATNKNVFVVRAILHSTTVPENEKNLERKLLHISIGIAKHICSKIYIVVQISRTCPDADYRESNNNNHDY